MWISILTFGFSASGPKKPSVDVVDDDTVITTPPSAGNAAEAEKDPLKLPPSDPVPVDVDEVQRQFYLKEVMKPSIGVQDTPLHNFGAFEWKLPEKKLWNKKLGENFCIIDIDNRAFDEEGELWSSKPMSWDKATKVHGLSLGILNHWLYGMFLQLPYPELHAC